PLALADGSSADAAAWTYKALAAAAMAAIVLLVSRLTASPFAVAFAGWNPLLALHLAGGGHNDAWMAALVVGALALAATGRRRLGGHTAALAFAAAFALAYVWLLREAWRGRVRLGLCAGLLLVATPWLVPWYAVWAVPLAAIDDDRWARLLALGFSGYMLRIAI